MEAIKTTIDAELLTGIIDLPESMRYGELELIVLPQTDRKKKSDDRSGIRSLKGCLHEYADPALRELEEGAWERAAVEKYLEKMKNDSI